MYRYSHNSSEACILITSIKPNNPRFGTGFVVYHFEQKSYIVTCAHVIDDVGRDSINADGYPAKIVAIGEADGLDLAVIETHEMLDKPVAKLGISGGQGTPFFTAGFRAFGKHFSISPLIGKISMTVALKSVSYSARIKAWNLVIGHDGKLHDGYSGSPVIDEDTGFCFGVISYKDGNGQSGLAISIEELEKIWSTLPVNLIDQSSENQPYCERLSRKAYQLFTTGDLGQSLEIYQQIKKIEPYYPNVETRIRIIKQEMAMSYVDRYGRVRDEDLFDNRTTNFSRANEPIRESTDYFSFRWNIIPLLLVLGFLIFILL